MILSSLYQAVRGFTVVEQDTLNLVLALFAFECALFYALTAVLHRQAAGVYLSAVMACGVVWQLFTWFGLPGECYALSYAVVGLTLLLASRVALLEDLVGRPVGEATFAAANVLLSLAFVSSALISLNRLLLKVNAPWGLVAVCLTLTGISLTAVFLVRQRGWRRWYVVTSILEALLAFLVLTLSSGLSPGQKVQIFSVAAGVVLLVCGHVGWYREQERDDDLVSTALVLGSLLAGVPMAVATMIDRFDHQFLLINELGFLLVALLLLTSGVLLRVQATTITGALLTALYFFTLLMFVPWDRLNTVAVLITIGGGTIFASGLVLSVFREHLLTLPGRIKNRQGVFKVLSWR
jgi:hypothetical protein